MPPYCVKDYINQSLLRCKAVSVISVQNKLHDVIQRCYKMVENYERSLGTWTQCDHFASLSPKYSNDDQFGED